MADALVNRATSLYEQDKMAKAESSYREALVQQSRQAHDALPLNYLAWPLATLPDPTRRNGALAVELAERAVALTDRKHSAYLDKLAAAYTEVGDFPRAADVQRETISHLSEQDDREDYESRLRLFEANSPYRQP